MSGNDVAAILGAANKDGGFFGDGIWGIIMLLIVAGIFTGGWGGFGGNAVAAGLTRAEMDNEFTQRDIFNTNTSVLTSSAQTQRDVLESRYTTELGLSNLQANMQACCCATQKEVLQNRYDNALAVANLQKDILLGNCDIKTTIAEDGEKTRALLTAQYQASLLEKINDLKAQVSNNEQTGYLLNTMGRWVGYSSCGTNCGCGCNGYNNLV